MTLITLIDPQCDETTQTPSSVGTAGTLRQGVKIFPLQSNAGEAVTIIAVILIILYCFPLKVRYPKMLKILLKLEVLDFWWRDPGDLQTAVQLAHLIITLGSLLQKF
jgi:hypothetical protein